MKEKLLQDTNITLSRKTNTITNEQGMSLLHEVHQPTGQLERSQQENGKQMEEMASKLEHTKVEHKKQVAQLQAANPIEDMRLIRSAALDEWAGLPK